NGAARSHAHHGRPAIGHDLLTRDVTRRGDGTGEREIVHQIPAAARLQVADEAIALVIDVGIDAVRRLRLPRLEDYAHVLVRGPDPHERQAVEQPDADVVADADARSRQLVREVLRAT